ncbi:MAG: BatA domain-containing protein [Cyclobacteriaceae bacterium]
MQRLIFESHPAFILLCIALGLGYAWLLYSKHQSWSRNFNRWLFALRAIVVSFLAFLLMGPIIKLTNQIFEKPQIVLLVDNSTSLKGVVDSVKLQNQLVETTEQLQQLGYVVTKQNLNAEDFQEIKFESRSSDLSGALKSVLANSEGKNLTSIILFSDGIYNSGASPLYNNWRLPIQTVGLGDSIEHPDLILKNVAFNKIAYQGNRFPVRAEVAIQRLPNHDVKVVVYKNGKIAGAQNKNTSNKTFLEFDFFLEANEKGIQNLEVRIEPSAVERNINNNFSRVFVDVVEGKKKILLIAPAPHPDIKALKAVVEKNPNYELIVHIPGVTKTDPKLLQPNQTELVIFHQPFDSEMKTASLYSSLSKGKSSVLLIVGGRTNLRLMTTNGVPLNFENNLQKDEVTPIVNTSFHDFDFLDNSNSAFSKFPPVQVPFGKFTYPPQAKILLNQRIGSVSTDRPMLLTWEDNNHKTAAFIGEGLWQWRLEEFALTEKSEFFDGTFSKLIQYLSTLEDKRKFRFSPLTSEFTDAAPAIFEGQVYNDLFEKIYGNKIEIELRDDQRKVSKYNYILSPGGERYQIGGLKAGNYVYSASTEIGGKSETVSGQFLVIQQNIEPQNLVADFGLLRKLSQNSGGSFYRADEASKLISDFKKTEAKALIHSEDSMNPLIHLKWLFLILLLLISAEWFLRKYLGSY